MKRSDKFIISIALFLTPALHAFSNSYLSEVWQPDLGNGKYKNPVINADYSDPDVVRVGNDYYMTSSSFCDIPGLPILHSTDLVNWEIIGHAIAEMPEYAQAAPDPSHGNHVWAPSIRYHNGEFYIYYGDPDLGIFMTKTKDPAGPWEPLVHVYKAKGVIDTCPFWDEDGKAYIAHGYAGSRAGVKSILGMIEMTPDGTQTIGQDRVIYDGHIENETIEGAKMYKRGDWYYIFSPAGGVATGWQEVLRSKSPWGPYEVRNVMDQGNTDINGPHQGAWIDTPDGNEDWFVHFQDKGPYGRVVHLQPMAWNNDGWPVIGVDPDGDGKGQPVTEYAKPKTGTNSVKNNPAESDEFDGIELGKQWQWKGNPNALWYFCDANNSQLRLFSQKTSDSGRLYDSSNLLLQKFPAENFTATTKVEFMPRKNNGKIMHGERAGLVIAGYNLGAIQLVSREDGIYLTEVESLKSNKGGKELETASLKLDENKPIYLRVNVKMTGKKPTKKEDYTSEAVFSYSFDGKKFTTFGKPLQVTEGHWIGAKVGLFCVRDWESNDSGWLNVDWFRISK